MIKAQILLPPPARKHLAVAEAANSARRNLILLNQAAAPAGRMLTLALGMQESQNSAELDGIITTQQDMYEYLLRPCGDEAEAKAARYSRAMGEGWQDLTNSDALPLDALVRIRQTIANSGTRWRQSPIADAPSPRLVPPMMAQLASQMHKETNADPLVRMAMIHYRLRNIQPFDSACSSTGRIVGILFLIKEGLLCAPVLYLSAYINRTRETYNRLLRVGGEKEWLLYMLGGIAITARHATKISRRIISAHDKLKKRIVRREGYREDLPLALYANPYITAAILSRELETSPEQAEEYLEELTIMGILQKMGPPGECFFINLALMDIMFTQPEIVP